MHEGFQQRSMVAWMGGQNEAMGRSYIHLFPERPLMFGSAFGYMTEDWLNCRVFDSAHRPRSLVVSINY